MADDRRSSLAEAMRLSQIGLMLVAPMLGLGGIGYWFDGRFATRPWLMVVGLVLGMVGGFVNFIHVVIGLRTGQKPGPPGGRPESRPPGTGERR
jgi:F0F1-type ATP synthase assembly protein I